MIFDSHAHYDDEAFDEDREELISSLYPAGITAVMNVGADKYSTERSLALTEKYDFFYGAAGIHPSDVEQYEEGTADIAWLEDRASRPKMLAIGEIGLDYHWPEPGRELQKKWFAAQLEAAKRLNKPVIIHSREAAQDTYDIMKAAGGEEIFAVIHCFSYEKEMAKRFLDLGYYIGIGGVLTYKNARKLVESAQYCPIDRILLETDCPYLSPVPKRGERNSSLNLPAVSAKLAEIKALSKEEVEDITYANAKRFYRI